MWANTVCVCSIPMVKRAVRLTCAMIHLTVVQNGRLATSTPISRSSECLAPLFLWLIDPSSTWSPIATWPCPGSHPSPSDPEFPSLMRLNPFFFPFFFSFYRNFYLFLSKFLSSLNDRWRCANAPTVIGKRFALAFVVAAATSAIWILSVITASAFVSLTNMVFLTRRLTILPIAINSIWNLSLQGLFW